MNKARRKEIERAQALLDEAQQILQACGEEEREYYDNMPESIQGSEKGDAADTAASELEDVAQEVEDLSSRLNDVTGAA